MRRSSRRLAAVVVTVVLAAPMAADAGERRWITNQDGQTIGYLEASPYGSDELVIRDRAGRTLGVIEEHSLGEGRVIRDRDGDRLGVIESRLDDHKIDQQIEGRQDRGGERSGRRDWRDGSAVEWGSHAERWGR